MSIDADLVQGLLTIPELLEAHGFEVRSHKGEARYNDCPSCGTGGRGKFTAADDVCLCHACGFAGNVFAVMGVLMDLDHIKHFRRILEACAALAGVGGDYDASELKARLKQRKRLMSDRNVKLAAEKAIAERGARQVWDKLRKHSDLGREYVASRGVLPQQAGRELRFTPKSVCLPLWRDNEVVNIVGRRFDKGQPKIRGLDRCGTRGTFGRPVRKRGEYGCVVIVEGFFDYLSARQMRPDTLVLGAHGCNNLAYVAEVAAKVIAGTNASLLLVTHQDEAGEGAMTKAREAAIEAGVSPMSVQRFDVDEGCNDLNDHMLRSDRGLA